MMVHRGLVDESSVSSNPLSPSGKRPKLEVRDEHAYPSDRQNPLNQVLQLLLPDEKSGPVLLVLVHSLPAAERQEMSMPAYPSDDQNISIQQSTYSIQK
jgi:hypothetical protein